MAALGERNETPWNTMGFGNKDPGKRRDTTLVKAGHFDRLYPIDLSIPVSLELGGGAVTLREVMKSLKGRLPYTYRYGDGSDLDSIVRVRDLPRDQASDAEAWLRAIAARLPREWVHVSLPGYVIAYPGLDETTVGSRTGSWRVSHGQVTYLPHDPDFADGTPESEEE